MVGRATLTMKKSTRGRDAASRTVNSPRVPSAGGAAAERTVGVVTVSVMAPSLRVRPDWYQSLLVLVQGVPGNRVRETAGWRHDDHGPGEHGPPGKAFGHPAP